ncbi:hypothetical protein PC128_g8650 [Phytophthora cactorum]|nr:hypothetical protein PC128_g8650 [Phytophthora cactorum]
MGNTSSSINAHEALVGGQAEVDADEEEVQSDNRENQESQSGSGTGINTGQGRSEAQRTELCAEAIAMEERAPSTRCDGLPEAKHR